ncbi:hypothetical protein [Mesobacillus jeotgali]|uniref:hypothetical protein n=1 Tax=Mesobacillus jeotgali TaxID=129985 RepID=UPI0009A8311B|nr:hypothetical protein [Mesobacillus jeotgali]
MNILKPALSISLMIHILYMIGIMSFAYVNDVFVGFKGETPTFFLFSFFIFTALITVILKAINYTR